MVTGLTDYSGLPLPHRRKAFNGNSIFWCYLQLFSCTYFHNYSPAATSFTYAARKTDNRKQSFEDLWKKRGEDKTEKSTGKGQRVNKTETEQEKQ